MTTAILDRVEHSLSEFRPKTQREFVALQIANRFNDRDRLAKYVNEAQRHSKKTLLETARLAIDRTKESSQPVADTFFELLAQLGEESSTKASSRCSTVGT
jgi:hypothetical protein